MGATISREDLKGKINRHDKFILIETLAPEAYAQAHLPGAVNAPVSQLQELAPKLVPAKDAEIVVYCASPT
ncbi:MAG: rhodanese-like domain-containing protein [Candidatus Acidiferrales bacterium]